MYLKAENCVGGNWKQSQTDGTCRCEYRKGQIAECLLIYGYRRVLFDLVLRKSTQTSLSQNPAVSNVTKWTLLCRARFYRTPRYLELFLAPLGLKWWPLLSRKRRRRAEKWRYKLAASSDWLDLPLRIQRATNCRCLLILIWIKAYVFIRSILLRKFDVSLATSNFRYLELFESSG